MKLTLPTLVLCATLWGCADTRLTCDGDGQVMINEHLYFGTSTPTGAVSDEQWMGFLADAVTPRFPAGLTHWQASGQWRSADNIILENAYVLNILRQDTPDSDNRIVELTMLYKQQFNQESVLRVSSPACASL